MTKEGIAQARRLCEEAIALDPEYAPAYIYLGATHWLDISLGSSKSPKESLKRAFEFIKKGKSLDESLPEAHTQLGWLYVMTRQHDKGIAECERAINLAPNSANAHIWMGLALKYAGRHEEAVRYSEQALRLDPLPPQWYLWAERYDRELKDIFALQDEITLKVLTGLQVKLTEGDQALILGKKLKNLDVYLKYLEAAAHFRKGTRESVTQYSQLGQEIIEMAPETAVGYQMLAWYYWYLYRTGTSPRESAAKAFKLAKKTLDMDKSDSRAHALLGSVYLLMRQHEKVIDSGKQAVALNPNGAFEHDSLGSTLTYAGRLDEAIDHLKRAIRLNPFPDYWYFQHLGVCYMLKGQYEEALTEFKKALHRAPDAPVNRVSLAVIYILLDRQEEARAVARKVLDIRPNFSVERVSKTMPFKNQADLKLVVDAMRKAGLG